MTAYRPRMTARRWILAVAGLALVLLVVAPFQCDGEHITMDDAARGGAPGRFARLRDGTVHYQVTGPETGPRVVLIHGVSGPMSGWDRIIPALGGAGFRVLRYDHFGRGHSDRLDGDHDEAFYDRELVDLLDAVGWTGPVALVGSSMGAIVAAGFANRHPDRVSRLVLVGPAGFPIEVSLGAKLLGVGGVGDYAIRVLGDRMLAAHHRKYFVDIDRGADVQAAFEAQLEVEGTKRSVLSTMRHMPINDYRDGYRTLGAAATPVLIVWGRADRTFPFSHNEEAVTLMPRATLAVIEDAAHLPHVEQPDAFARAVIPFLRAEAAPP